MTLYCGIDLHSTSSYVVVQDERAQVALGKKVPNQLEVILGQLEPYRDELVGVVVESTFNWYWLVDGLMDAGYRLHLAHPAGMQQYAGLKYTDDRNDARWLAHLLQLGLLAEGHIYPREERAVRDLLRKRAHLVRQQTANLLSLQNLWSRNTGELVRGNELKKLSEEAIRDRLAKPELELAMETTLAVLAVLAQQILRLEKAVFSVGKLKNGYQLLQGIPGVGKILGLTVVYETGSIGRFAAVGNYASYCRCTDSRRISNGKKKGVGNKRNGNRYLSWAFVEAANFIARYEPRARRFLDRKTAKTNRALAVRALAGKLARATYYMLRDQKPFEIDRLFA